MLFTKTTESDTRVHPGESKLIIAARTSPLPSPKSLLVRFFALFVDSGVALKGSCELRLDLKSYGSAVRNSDCRSCDDFSPRSACV